MDESFPAKRFGPTSGVFSGVAGLSLCAGAVVFGFLDGDQGSIRLALAAAVAAVPIWAYLLRPRIVIEEGGRTLLLRNPIEDIRIPLAAVKVVGVRVVTTVKTDDERFDAVAVGHPLRKIVRPRRPDIVGGGMLGAQGRLPGIAAPEGEHRDRITRMSTPELMTETVLAAAGRARSLNFPAGPAERIRALPEIVAFAVLAVAFVVSLVV